MKKSFTLKLFALLLVVGLLFAAVPTGQVQAQFYRAQAINDNYETEANVILSVDTPGVLSNDSYISSHFRAVEIVNGSDHGTLTMEDNGSFTYEPDENFVGTDTFEYKIRLRTGLFGITYYSNTATVTIMVTPKAVDDEYTTAEDVILSVDAPGVLLNDPDYNAITMTAVKASSPAHGVLVLASDGSFVYTPDQDYYGTDSFTYYYTGGVLPSNIATVTITVTPVKDQVIANDDEYDTNEGVTLTVDTPGVLDNDIDVDDNTMTASLVSGVSDGTLTLNGDGSFVYIPDAGFTGTDTFEYELVTTPAANSTVQQSLWTDIATVTIEVLENVAPVAVDDAYTTEENMVLNILKTDGVLANDIDFDWTILTAVKVTDPGNGTLVLNTDGSFTYTPNTGFTGVDIFTYKANDGEFDSNIATVRITVEAYVNTPVVAEDDYYETMVDTTLIKDAAEGVLANDTLLDPEEIVTVQILDEPQHGTLTMEDDGSFIYIPDAGFMGRDTFRYIVFSLPAGLQAEWSDDAWVYIDVKPVMRLFLPIILR